MTGSTLMNAESSRSHSIFTITIEATSKMTAATAAGADDDNHIRVGKCNLVDLAGSERQSKTGASGEWRQTSRRLAWMLSFSPSVFEVSRAGA